jgi:uncharacterized protein (TIGR00369 family)
MGTVSTYLPDLPDLKARVLALQTGVAPEHSLWAAHPLRMLDSGAGSAQVALEVTAAQLAAGSAGGLLGLLADVTCGGAAFTSAEPLWPSVTTSLSVEVLEAAHSSPGSWVCSARTAGQATGNKLFTGDMADARGATVGRCSVWFAPVDLARSVTAQPVPSAQPAPPGSHPVRLEPNMCNLSGAAHGGVVAHLCDSAARAVPEVSGMRTSSMQVTYLRSPGVVGDDVHLSTEVVRAGRRLAVVDVRMWRPDGRLGIDARVTLCRP